MIADLDLVIARAIHGGSPWLMGAARVARIERRPAGKSSGISLFACGSTQKRNRGSDIYGRVAPDRALTGDVRSVLHRGYARAKPP